MVLEEAGDLGEEGGVEGDGECVKQSRHLFAHEIIFIFPSTI